MPINVFKYDGTLLTTIADGTIDTTHSTLKFPGTGYQNYGPPIMENILWTMQNFAGSTQPTLPLTGQTWFDTTTGLLKVYTGTAWQAAGGVLVNSSVPATPSNVGAFWYDSVNMQMSVWNGAAWDIIGPLGSAVNSDPISNTSIPPYSKVDSVKITDSGSASHQVWRITIGGTLFAIVSKDAEFTPAPAIAGFATIKPGINFNTTVAGAGISGDTTAFRNNQNNLPDTSGTRDLGSSALRFRNINARNGYFFNSLLVNVESSSSSYTFHVNGESYLNGTVLLTPGSASQEPIRLQQGNLLTTPRLGALEFDGNNIYVTLNVGGVPTRSVISAGTSGGSTAAEPNTLALRDSNADIYANVFQGIASSARYADLAERYETDMPLEPGDVVILGGAREITKSVSENTWVFGIISTNPAFRMNENAGDDTTHPFVAMVGRVPCKVSGPVKKGEQLVSSKIHGVATSIKNVEPGFGYNVFARSLVDKTTDDVEVIEVVLVNGLR